MNARAQRLGSRTLRLLDVAVEAVATMAFIVMFAAALGQVLFRYVLQIPVPWTEELARVLFTCAMLLGIAIAIRRNEHIDVQLLSGRVSPRTRAVVFIVFDILILMLLALLARGTAAMTALTWGTYLIALDWLREGWLFVIQFIAILLMILYTALRLAENLRILSGTPGAARRSGSSAS